MSMSNYDDDKTLRLPRKASRSKHYNERVPIENKLRDELFFGNHASSRSPATRRVYTSMFRDTQAPTLCALDVWTRKDSWQAQGIVRL